LWGQLVIAHSSLIFVGVIGDHPIFKPLENQDFPPGRLYSFMTISFFLTARFPQMNTQLLVRWPLAIPHIYYF
jgi:hypothetical protein